MIQIKFAEKAANIFKKDASVIGLAVGGAWLSNEIDEFSDLDLILVTSEKISNDKTRMLGYAESLGNFITGFTGEHVGEPRLLICLFDNPLLHVDIKFITIEEFSTRVEEPVILFDRDHQLQKVLDETTSQFPHPDYQWIEDRFWIWIHYTLLKIGRGELIEAFDCFGFLRMVVLGPLMHIKNGNLPKGVRRAETDLDEEDFLDLKSTLPVYERKALLRTLRNSVEIYRNLRVALFTPEITLQKLGEDKVMQFFQSVEKS